jgi:hypothetical protein
MASQPTPDPVVSEHSSVACEKAKNPNVCICKCRGAAHQSNVLLAAITAKPKPEEFDGLLTNVFGARFTSLSESPSPTHPQRSGRSKWADPASAGKNKWRGQREQRIVDVTLRDALALVYLLPKKAKKSWEEVAGALILRKGLQGFTDEIDKIKELKQGKNAQSAFFWSAVLAALSESTSRVELKPFSGGGKALSAVKAIPSTVKGDGVFAMHCKPRQSRTKLIIEVSHEKAVSIAAKHIQPAAEKAHKLGMSQDEFALLVQIVGSTVSADLWHHPAAVRHLLTPAVAGLRDLAKKHKIDSSFSLDGQEPEQGLAEEAEIEGLLPVERLLVIELGQKWRQRSHWGTRD